MTSTVLPQGLKIIQPEARIRPIHSVIISIPQLYVSLLNSPTNNTRSLLGTSSAKRYWDSGAMSRTTVSGEFHGRLRFLPGSKSAKAMMFDRMLPHFFHPD